MLRRNKYCSALRAFFGARFAVFGSCTTVFSPNLGIDLLAYCSHHFTRVVPIQVKARTIV